MKHANPASAYPAGRLLFAIGASAATLIVLWTLIRLGGELSPEVYRAGVLGLASATLAHILGAVAGGFFIDAHGCSTAYLASTVVRFLLTPLLALSLYFALPVQPTPLLIGATVGYLVILVADMAVMLKSAQRGERDVGAAAN
jgi:hypothetical protein